MARPTRPCVRLLPPLLVFLGHLATPARAEETPPAPPRSEGIPALPDALVARLAQYQSLHGAAFAGWLGKGEMLIAARSGQILQLHRLREPGGTLETLTRGRDPVASVVTPRRGESGFVYASDRDGNEVWQLYYYDVGRGQTRLLTDGRSRNQGAVFSRDGTHLAYSTTRRNGIDADIHLLDLRGRSTPLLELGGAWLVNDWAPNGRLLLATDYYSVAEMRPWLVRTDNGARAPLFDYARPAAYPQLGFSSDGRSLYFLSDRDGEYTALYRLSLRNGEFEKISDRGAWDITGFALSNDGRYLAYVRNRGGFGRLHLRRLPSLRQVVLPELPRGVLHLGGFSPDSRKLALSIDSPGQPIAVYALDLKQRSLTPWTRPALGALQAEPFVAPEPIRFPSFDQAANGRPRRIPAFYYRPPGPGPFPVLIELHGGPEVQALPGFDAEIQFLVKELGMAVLVPNVRGSAGYGKTYLALDNGLRREDAVRDVGALFDWIAGRPELDAARVGVAGASYGGYLALATLARYPERVRAGQSAFGISHFVSFLESTPDWRAELRRAEYGDERDPAMREFLARISPLNQASRIRAPLFVVHGGNDPRVPVTEAEQIVRAVRDNGGPVWSLVFPDEGHGLARESHRDYFGAASMLFWRDHLLGERSAAGPSDSDTKNQPPAPRAAGGGGGDAQR